MRVFAENSTCNGNVTLASAPQWPNIIYAGFGDEGCHHVEDIEEFAAKAALILGTTYLTPLPVYLHFRRIVKLWAGH